MQKKKTKGNDARNKEYMKQGKQMKGHPPPLPHPPLQAIHRPKPYIYVYTYMFIYAAWPLAISLGVAAGPHPQEMPGDLCKHLTLAAEYLATVTN